MSTTAQLFGFGITRCTPVSGQVSICFAEQHLSYEQPVENDQNGTVPGVFSLIRSGLWFKHLSSAKLTIRLPV